MAAFKHQRRIFLWKLRAEPVPKDAPVKVSVMEIIALIRKMYADGQAFVFLDQDARVVDDPASKDPRNCIYIADVQDLENGHVVLVINRGDPDVVHPSFLNPVSNTVNTVDPNPGEVQGWSAHLVVDVNKPSAVHRGCLESVPNVSPTLVKKYINILIEKAVDQAGNFEYDRPIKKGKKYVVERREYKPKLLVTSPPSASLAEDIEKGALSSITLSRPVDTYQGAGDPTMVNRAYDKLVIQTKSAHPNRAKAFALDVMAWGKANGYQQAEVKISGLPGNASASPRFDLEDTDAKELLYSRTRIIQNFSKELRSCYAKMDSEIVMKMVYEIGKEENW